MPNWAESMSQTFEYHLVDPATWKEKGILENVTAASISRDSDSDTCGSASFDIVTNNIGEEYIRPYLVTVQNGYTNKYPLGTYLVQTVPSSFDGKISTISADAYTPLIELKENPPDLGYSLTKGTNIMEAAYLIIRDHTRAPVVKTESTAVLTADFVANTDDTWLSFVIDLVNVADYNLGLDDLGQIIFLPKQSLDAMQPIWTYADDENSILEADITVDKDIYGIPNVVEVVYSTDTHTYVKRAVNDNPNSPISTVNRGREIIKRITDPVLSGDLMPSLVQEYADKQLKSLSNIGCQISYTHGFCPTRVGDCVLINYRRAGLNNVKAIITSQSISCESGCKVSETATFTSNLWR